ncbi:MAG TPA: HD domain-containing protein [Solirubrobacterales bacterium]
MSRLLGDIGTIEWARRTKGILGRGEQARFTAAVCLQTARALPRVLGARGGRGGSGPDPAQLTPPDSPFAKEVVEACSELEPAVVEHSYRSYVFARALGVVEKIECDEEALFATAMFHDHAFPEVDSLTDRCFAVAGAEAAERFLESSPLSGQLRDDVLDAICLHINPWVDRERGAIQFLAHDGIALDVLGMRAWELDRPGTRRVFERHPRHRFNSLAATKLRRHGRRVHGCRTAALLATGFGRALKLSPWAPLE